MPISHTAPPPSRRPYAPSTDLPSDDCDDETTSLSPNLPPLPTTQTQTQTPTSTPTPTPTTSNRNPPLPAPTSDRPPLWSYITLYSAHTTNTIPAIVTHHWSTDATRYAARTISTQQPSLRYDSIALDVLGLTAHPRPPLLHTKVTVVHPHNPSKSFSARVEATTGGGGGGGGGIDGGVFCVVREDGARFDSNTLKAHRFSIVYEKPVELLRKLTSEAIEQMWAKELKKEETVEYLDDFPQPKENPPYGYTSPRDDNNDNVISLDSESDEEDKYTCPRRSDHPMTRDGKDCVTASPSRFSSPVTPRRTNDVEVRMVRVSMRDDVDEEGRGRREVDAGVSYAGSGNGVRNRLENGYDSCDESDFLEEHMRAAANGASQRNVRRLKEIELGRSSAHGDAQHGEGVSGSGAEPFERRGSSTGRRDMKGSHSRKVRKTQRVVECEDSEDEVQEDIPIMHAPQQEVTTTKRDAVRALPREPRGNGAGNIGRKTALPKIVVKRIARRPCKNQTDRRKLVLQDEDMVYANERVHQYFVDGLDERFFSNVGGGVPPRDADSSSSQHDPSSDEDFDVNGKKTSVACTSTLPNDPLVKRRRRKDMARSVTVVTKSRVLYGRGFLRCGGRDGCYCVRWGSASQRRGVPTVRIGEGLDICDILVEMREKLHRHNLRLVMKRMRTSRAVNEEVEPLPIGAFETVLTTRRTGRRAVVFWWMVALSRQVSLNFGVESIWKKTKSRSAVYFIGLMANAEVAVHCFVTLFNRMQVMRRAFLRRRHAVPEFRSQMERTSSLHERRNSTVHQLKEYMNGIVRQMDTVVKDDVLRTMGKLPKGEGEGGNVPEEELLQMVLHRMCREAPERVRVEADLGKAMKRSASLELENVTAFQLGMTDAMSMSRKKRKRR